VQRYEGASTLHGQHTLNAYINATLTHLPYLSASPPGSIPAGPSPPDHRNKSISLITGVVYDSAPLGKKYGQETTAPAATYPSGALISATFVGANPRNNLRLGGTFAAIERADGAQWTQVRTDADWDLTFQWKRVNGLTGTSEVVVTWDTGVRARGDVVPGRYRVRYYGDAKALGGKITAFEGTSGVFEVL
jgi:neutral ceramidase